MSRTALVADDLLVIFQNQSERAMGSLREMMMDRPAIRLRQATDEFAIKSILFHVHADDGLEHRLQTALSLARACSAHIELLQVVPIDAYTVVDTYGGAFVSGQIIEALQEEAAEVRKRLEARLSAEDISWSFVSKTSSVVPEMVRSAALSDMVFMGRQPRTREFMATGPSLLGQVLCSARTPLCIPGDVQTSFDPFGPAVIAWNGSLEAANAVRAGIGLLRMASSVRVLRFKEERDRRFPDTRLLEYLARHGISAVLEEQRAPRDIADKLVQQASAGGDAYILMGGYSHSRAGEFLFGGVTRELLQECPVTLVMAH